MERSFFILSTLFVTLFQSDYGKRYVEGFNLIQYMTKIEMEQLLLSFHTKMASNWIVNQHAINFIDFEIKILLSSPL